MNRLRKFGRALLYALSILLVSAQGGGAQGGGFVDVPAGPTWAQAINDLKARGYVVGKMLEPPTFAPYDQATRAEMAVLLVRAKHGPGFKPGVLSTQVDVPATHWACLWIGQAIIDGLMSDFPDGHFGPDAPATRADVATLLWLALP